MVSAQKRLPPGMVELSNMICGCCTVETTWSLILARLLLLYRGGHRSPDDMVDVVLDSCGLTEHGTSIRGAWLTEKGAEALRFLETWGPDWEHAGEFVDDEGVHHGNIQ